MVRAPISPITIIAAALALALTVPAAARSDDLGDTIQRCLAGAARRNQVPADLLILLYENEGGALGRVSRNADGTVDIGPFQINQIWVPALAKQWRLPPSETYQVLLSQFCANAEAAAWILRQNLDAAQGDVWQAVGLYHSANPVLQRRYLQQIYRHATEFLKDRKHG